MNKPDKKYKGVIIPMVTPLTKGLEIDENAVIKLCASFIDSNCAPFLLGTTGESVSIPEQKKRELVKFTVNAVNNKQKVYAGISGNCLEESIDSAKAFADLGVDAVVAHLPFYYPIGEKDMLMYFEEIANNVPCPLFLYNNPITTKYSIPIEVIEKLSYHSNIVGFKDSERGIERLDQALELWKNRDDFSYLLGWAAQSAYSLLNGADGIVPSTGNIIPEVYYKLYEKAISGIKDEAYELQEYTNKVSEIYQKDRNIRESIPALKVMLSVFNLSEPFVMPPMYVTEQKEQEIIKNIIKNDVSIKKVDK